MPNTTPIRSVMADTYGESAPLVGDPEGLSGTYGEVYGNVTNITKVRSMGIGQGSCNADIRRGEPIDEYHSDAAYKSCSGVKTFLDSPHLYHQQYITKTIQPFSSDALSHGSLLHEWFERGNDFLESLVVPPKERLTPTGLIGKEAYQWAKNEAPEGIRLITAKERAQVLAEVSAIESHPAARELREQIVDRETSVRWVTDEGYRLRCRYDARTPDAWVDLKTTSEQDILANWWKAVIRFRYHMQDAWYQRGMEACGTDAAPLIFIVVSASVSHDCQVVTLPPRITDEGRRLMDRALADMRVREDLDWWLPESHGEVVELEFPAYALERST